MHQISDNFYIALMPRSTLLVILTQSGPNSFASQLKAVVSTYGMLSYYTYIYDVVSPHWSFESLKAGREELKVETIGSIAKKPNLD